jgi:hypothetical protein
MCTTEERLQQIKARVAASTPGPWDVDAHYTLLSEEGDWLGDIASSSDADADFIACSREDVPWLLAEVERLRAENAALAGERDRLREALDAVERANEIGIAPDTIHCRHCRAVCVTPAPLIHEPDCPFAVLNEEPTDAD